ncbi:MAG: hypothetical protein J5640_06430 [Bacteroidales bacterium]|nr:hypothetical protein [Bacteroidales bacterium]
MEATQVPRVQEGLAALIGIPVMIHGLFDVLFDTIAGSEGQYANISKYSSNMITNRTRAVAHRG